MTDLSQRAPTRGVIAGTEFKHARRPAPSLPGHGTLLYLDTILPTNISSHTPRHLAEPFRLSLPCRIWRFYVHVRRSCPVRSQSLLLRGGSAGGYSAWFLVQESKPGLANVEPKRKRGPGYRRCHRRRSRRGWHCLVFLSLKSFSTVVYSPRLEYDFHKRSPPIVVPQWFLFYMILRYFTKRRCA